MTKSGSCQGGLEIEIGEIETWNVPGNVRRKPLLEELFFCFLHVYIMTIHLHVKHCGCTWSLFFEMVSCTVMNLFLFVVVVCNGFACPVPVLGRIQTRKRGSEIT